MALNLTTRADYKSYVGIKNTNSDAIIDFLIPKVSNLVKTYCRRTFVDHWVDPKVEIFNGGFPEIILPETPVISITTLERSVDYGQTYETLTPFVDYVLDQDLVKSLDTNGFKELLRGYKVTYLAGYEDTPPELELAVMDLITYYMRNDSAIHSQKTAGSNNVQIEYVMTTNMPAHIKRILDLYVTDYN